MSTRANQLSRTIARLQGLPLIGPWATNVVLGRVVPFVGTSGLRYEVLSGQRVVVRIRNQRKVQNHIRGVHAAAMALLAETATGFCVGWTVRWTVGKASTFPGKRRPSSDPLPERMNFP